MNTIPPDRKPYFGFTLVEVLVVVVILAILAAIVVPQFVSASNESHTGALKMDLRRIRTQLEIYRQYHDEEYPLLADFADQMTLASDATRATAPIGTPGFALEPYIQSVPANPFTGTNTI